MMKVVLVIFLFSGCAQGKPIDTLKIYNAPEGRLKLVCENDFYALRKIASIFPHEDFDKIPEVYLVPLHLDDGSDIRVVTDFKSKSNKLVIYSARSRGKWLHEFCHYYNYYIAESYRDEFILTVMDWLVTGLPIDVYVKGKVVE